jgi:DNA repair exonuclease SbcCD ATPase subunit
MTDEPPSHTKNKTMKKTDTKSATAQLQDLNAQIEALKQQKTALAEPMKARHAELRSELLQVETEIRELDPSWKPAGRQKPEEKIAEIITAHGSPMTLEEIGQAVNGAFSAWKLKSTLKKKSTGPKSIFTLADGKYALKST